MVDISGIARIRRMAYDYELRGSNKLLKYNDVELSRIYNGVGPDRWPDNVRKMLTGLASLYEAAVMIHDVEFKESDGTVSSFLDTVDHFRANVKIIRKTEYPLWTWNMLEASYRVKRAAAIALGAALVVAVSSDTALEIFKAEASK